jgi:hypothetical protein
MRRQALVLLALLLWSPACSPGEAPSPPPPLDEPAQPPRHDFVEPGEEVPHLAVHRPAAILWHGGEAEAAREHVRQLDFCGQHRIAADVESGTG